MAIEEVYRHPDDYDLELASRGVDDLPFWLHLIRRERPTRILEVGCGTGRLTVPLAREGAARGFTVTGLEPETPMLERARLHREREPRAVREALHLVHGDARSLELPCRFDLAMLPYGVAHHLLEIDDQLAALRAIRRHLTPDGLLCVDLNAPDVRSLAKMIDGRPRQVDMDVNGQQGRHLRRSVASRYAPATQRATYGFEYESEEPDGRRRRYPSDFAMHVFFPREIELLCRLAGYNVETLIGSYTGEPFGDGSPQLIALARAV